MKVGFVGLGKLGLPVSVAMSYYHDVTGYESQNLRRSELKMGHSGLYEPEIDNLLKTALSKRLTIADRLSEAVQGKDLVFFAVQTPSKPDDSFDTSFLENAVREASVFAHKNQMFVIISTVLPGTIRSRIWPLLSSKIAPVHLCYNASFIAMGTTIADFLSPEFILLGGPSVDRVEEFYHFLPETIPRLRMTWEEAELTKMAYNTMIGFKIVYANTLMELCHKLGNANVDTVSNALSKATRRIVGPAYLKGGMGDGGACHPRDNLALSWLARKYGLSANPFAFVMDAREKQATWIAREMRKHQPPYIILGARYKPNTNLTDYSASLLVNRILKTQYHDGTTGPFLWDPLAGYDKNTEELRKPGTFLIAVPEETFTDFKFPAGSTIIDPWRVMQKPPEDCHYVPVGISH